MTILVITTGGTIGAVPYRDPIHPPKSCTLPEDGCDIVQDVIQTTFRNIRTRCFSLGLRDSWSIDNAYREKLLDVIRSAPEEKVLMTHGTDSLIQTADFLYAKMKDDTAFDRKVVILTGAMVPLANGPESDGYQNLCCALQQLSVANDGLTGLNIVLCDFDTEGVWRPHLYRFEPNRYEKVYAPDGRYNRLYDRG
ncbi:MAG: asparaginase domain-containing protein [Alphaproteobacteria bacterium]|nr:asparaginase domain-containing protein [Alphaproteobacteria bacterium]